MKDEDRFFEEGEEGEEEPFKFEFDDLSEENSEEASGDSVLEEEVINLADVVDEGRIIEDLESDEILLSLDEDEFLEEERAAEVGPGLSQGLNSELDVALEGLESSEEVDADLEVLESELEDIADEELLEDTALDIEGRAESKALEEMPASEKAAVFQLTEELIGGVSEERIEAIITRVVQDVVEKVTRETMTTVAERVIGEAIDALKQSLESPEEYRALR